MTIKAGFYKANSFTPLEGFHTVDSSRVKSF